MTDRGIPAVRLGCHAAFALPLAMAALPVYVHVPKLYADIPGVGLAAVGIVLMAARFADALQDPLLGWWSDRVVGRGRGRDGFLVAAVALLGIGITGLFSPPAVSGTAALAWLAACLVVTYLGFSLGTINYFAIGASMSDRYHERTRITAARSAVGVAGVLIAATLPEVLGGERGLEGGLRAFAMLYGPILVVGAGITLFGGMPARPERPGPGPELPLAAVFLPLRDATFRWLLVVFVASGVASAIPATLILFYVQDVLGRPDLNGLFLATYFVFGALGMPLWVRASGRFGKKRAWMAAMGAAVVAFVWAFALGPGDVTAFALVCALSGIAYGAELALPPSILADVADSPGTVREGAYFGFWQLAEKMNLAAAAGVALPVLGLIGYQPGEPQPAMGDLSAMYALVPCLLKLGALAVLWLSPLDAGRVTAPEPSLGKTT